MAAPPFRVTFRAMASAHEIQIAGADAHDAQRAAAAAMADVLRIEHKYSRYRDDSVTARINREAGGKAVPIDAEGRVAIDYGVYGAPGTFLIDPRGVIVHKQIGPLTPEIWERDFVRRATSPTGEGS